MFCVQVKFDELVAQTEVARRRQEERAGRQRAVLQQKIQEVKQEMKGTLCVCVCKAPGPWPTSTVEFPIVHKFSGCSAKLYSQSINNYAHLPLQANMLATGLVCVCVCMHV